ncbi:MAG: hypothetical protein R6U19_07365, partial [Bacteroidales bacterium]
MIFSGFLPRTLKGETAENQPPFRVGVKLILSGCENLVFLDRTQFCLILRDLIQTKPKSFCSFVMKPIPKRVPVK